MTIRPKTPTDLMLAPVAAEIDRNLRHLRDLTPAEIDDELAVAENVDTRRSTRAAREQWIVDAATRFVDLHHWSASVSSDAWRLTLQGGSVSLDIGLSSSLTRYIESGSEA